VLDKILTYDRAIYSCNQGGLSTPGHVDRLKKKKMELEKLLEITELIIESTESTQAKPVAE
jgi:hypothetical protein